MIYPDLIDTPYFIGYRNGSDFNPITGVGTVNSIASPIYGLDMFE